MTASISVTICVSESRHSIRVKAQVEPRICALTDIDARTAISSRNYAEHLCCAVRMPTANMRPALLPCQVDSYLRCLYTQVVTCVPCEPTQLKHFAVGHAPRWVLTLDGSPLYPAGGGQPSDTGFLRPLSPDAGRAAEDTEQNWSIACPGRSGDVKVLSVAKQQQGVEHVVDSPLPEGAAVAVCVDWERRYDHMQQHTGAAPSRQPSRVPAPACLKAACTCTARLCASMLRRFPSAERSLNSCATLRGSCL